MANKFKSKSRDAKKSEFDHKVIDIARVARVMAGGRRFSFRASVIIGDRKGRVGVGVGKGSDTAISIEKAINNARKNLITVDIQKGTVPFDVSAKYGSAAILVKPAKEGKGIVAGGAARTVFDLVGLKDVTSKMMGSNNKLNNSRATIKALLKTQV
jgi:small subunit ribosomal protein S5